MPSLGWEKKTRPDCRRAKEKNKTAWTKNRRPRT